MTGRAVTGQQRLNRQLDKSHGDRRPCEPTRRGVCATRGLAEKEKREAEMRSSRSNYLSVNCEPTKEDGSAHLLLPMIGCWYEHRLATRRPVCLTSCETSHNGQRGEQSSRWCRASWRISPRLLPSSPAQMERSARRQFHREIRQDFFAVS